jgi:hypothetical protein
MRRPAVMALSIAGSAAALLLTAAQQPSPLAGVKAGQWQLQGVPGAASGLQECVTNLLALARFEHRGKSCSSRTISQSSSSIVVEYSCGGAGFGHSQIDVLTPRSLRISTQGISDSLPFNYVLQAHRVGDCGPAAPSH